MLVHTEKGQQILSEIKEELRIVPVEVNLIIEGSKELSESVAPNNRRAEFFSDAITMDGYALFEKYFPETAKVKLKRMVRMTAFKLGIYSVTKKAFVRMTGKY